MTTHTVSLVISGLLASGPLCPEEIIIRLREEGVTVSKSELKEAIWRLLDAEEEEITRDYKLRGTV